MPKTVKQLQAKNSYKQPMQFDVAKAIEPPKIKSADIFDMMGAKKKTATPKKKKKAVPKGSHRMPDGSIMKDSAMKKKKKKY
tara:strand:- start:313 stop:558 length:246 start_codon:yes stop_codon:yes gene_type:complete